METTKNNLSPNTKKFFNELSDYLETKFYYFGSVQRSDYIPGKSDIDVDIFTENEYSTMAKMQHFLHVKKNDFRRVVWIINGETTYGYKIKYENKPQGIEAEFSIYNEKFKDLVLSEHIHKLDLPSYAIILLQILKILFYKLHIISYNTYVNSKRYILSFGIGQKEEDKFLVI